MNSMRAAIVEKAGPPESFRIVEMPIPEPKESEVIVRQTYAAVNFGDVTRRKRGLFPPNVPPPYVLGFEGVGTIERMGSAVTGLRIGDRIAYLLERGGYAEFVAVPAAQSWAVPSAISDDAAAGITCVGLTAWGLKAQSGVRPGDTALVHGAAGGVGSILVQVLEAQETRTIALVTGQEKRDFVTRLGAKIVLDRANVDVENEIKKHCSGGVDVVFDCVGLDVLGINLATIKAGGVWMYYGSTSGHPQFPGDRVLMNRLSIRGFIVFEFARDHAEWKQGTAFLLSSLTNGIIKTQTTEILPLDQVSKAHRRLEARAAMGKLLLSF